MRECGYTVIEPDTLTFEEQIRFFSSAEVIVGQAGAGMMNLAFAPSDCVVIILTKDSPFHNYFYFSNVSAALGQSVTYLFGERAGPDDTERPGDGLQINPDALRKFLVHNNLC
jgi:capsular polysaccharide biosynthesis protein